MSFYLIPKLFVQASLDEISIFAFKLFFRYLKARINKWICHFTCAKSRILETQIAQKLLKIQIHSNRMAKGILIKIKISRPIIRGIRKRFASISNSWRHQCSHLMPQQWIFDGRLNECCILRVQPHITSYIVIFWNIRNVNSRYIEWYIVAFVQTWPVLI